jgi:nicotinamide riboside transporter PnuC
LVSKSHQFFVVLSQPANTAASLQLFLLFFLSWLAHVAFTWSEQQQQQQRRRSEWIKAEGKQPVLMPLSSATTNSFTIAHPDD